jgi:hypothetical protein
MAYQKNVTTRAIRILATQRERLKEIYIDTYLQQTGYIIDQCELVETMQQGNGNSIETTWFMRLREEESYKDASTDTAARRFTQITEQKWQSTNPTQD